MNAVSRSTTLRVSNSGEAFPNLTAHVTGPAPAGAGSPAAGQGFPAVVAAVVGQGVGQGHATTVQSSISLRRRSTKPTVAHAQDHSVLSSSR